MPGLCNRKDATAGVPGGETVIDNISYKGVVPGIIGERMKR
jgi:hypothetical protein